MQVVIGQVLFDRLNDIAAGEQQLQFFGNGGTAIIDKRADDGVVAGILPIADRFL